MVNRLNCWSKETGPFTRLISNNIRMPASRFYGWLPLAVCMQEDQKRNWSTNERPLYKIKITNVERSQLSLKLWVLCQLKWSELAERTKFGTTLKEGRQGSWASLLCLLGQAFIYRSMSNYITSHHHRRQVQVVSFVSQAFTWGPSRPRLLPCPGRRSQRESSSTWKIPCDHFVTNVVL